MHLGGKYLILMRGVPGSRRDEIADLLAGGVAYLSTVAEYKGEAIEGIHRMSGGTKLERHAPVVVLSTDDCFWPEKEVDGKKVKVWEYFPERQKDADENCLQRCRASMQKGINVIIVNNIGIPIESAEPYLALAVEFEYEVIPVSIPDFRISVLDKRMAQSKKEWPKESAYPSCLPSPKDVWLPVFRDDKPLPIAGFVNKNPEYRPIQPPSSVDDDEATKEPDQDFVVHISSFQQGGHNASMFLKSLGIRKLIKQRVIYNTVENQGEVYIHPLDGNETHERIRSLARDYGVQIQIVTK